MRNGKKSWLTGQPTAKAWSHWEKLREDRCKLRSRGRVTTTTEDNVPFTSWSRSAANTMTHRAQQRAPKACYHISRSICWHGGRYCTQTSWRDAFRNQLFTLVKNSLEINGFSKFCKLKWLSESQKLKQRQNLLQDFWEDMVLSTKNRVQSRLTTTGW